MDFLQDPKANEDIQAFWQSLDELATNANDEALPGMAARVLRSEANQAVWPDQFYLYMVRKSDQLETDWMGCIESKDAEAVAAAYLLFAHPLNLTMKHLGIVIAVSD